MKKTTVFYIYIILLVMAVTSCQELFFQERENIVRLGLIREIGVDYIAIGGVLLDVSDQEDNPIITYGHCWSSTIEEPTLANSDSLSDLGEPKNFGEFNTRLQNLTPETNYFIRAYAQSSEKEEYDGINQAIIPGLVRTRTAFNISLTTATVEGFMSPLVNSMQRYGHCWAKNKVPNINDTKTEETVIPLEPFYSDIIGLEPNSTYYVRTYMIDSNGIPNYGDLVRFQTGSE